MRSRFFLIASMGACAFKHLLFKRHPWPWSPQAGAAPIIPTHNPGDPAAVRRFREVSEAYEVLSDRARREEYDAKIKSTS